MWNQAVFCNPAQAVAFFYSIYGRGILCRNLVHKLCCDRAIRLNRQLSYVFELCSGLSQRNLLSILIRNSLVRNRLMGVAVNDRVDSICVRDHRIGCPALRCSILTKMADQNDVSCSILSCRIHRRLNFRVQALAALILTESIYI